MREGPSLPAQPFQSSDSWSALATHPLIFTDEHQAYKGLLNHKAVKHSVGQYVKNQARTNGIESFWALLKRGYYGTCHKMSPKHLQRYVDEFSGRHNVRQLDTLQQMTAVVKGADFKRLRYRDLVK